MSVMNRKMNPIKRVLWMKARGSTAGVQRWARVS